MSIIPAAYYQYVYLLVVTLTTLYAMSLYNIWGKQFRAKVPSQFVVILVLFFTIIFIGTRPISSVFYDMVGYNDSYEMLFGGQFWFDWEANNLIWDNFFVWMASVGISFTTWVLIVAAAYFGLMYWACQRLFKKDALLAFVMYLGAFSTFAAGTNGMKAGVAASLFLVAMAYRDKLWVSIPIALLTYGFHHSMAMVIAAYLIVLCVKDPKYYLWGWIACVIIATLHISYFQMLFSRFTDEHGASYLTATKDYEGYLTGFRPDFILYSAVPIVVGYYIINKYVYRSKTYFFLLNLYTMTNSLWMLCMYASFSNRIAYLSWFMYPIVLLFPFVHYNTSQKHGKYLRWVVYGHLGFTLFMNLIYYA